jgi:hypothetical protein
MQTVQLQCGNCQKIMAISVEHLGSQVHCPHCRAVVQTPPRSSVIPPPPPTPAIADPPPFAPAGADLFPPPPRVDESERDSIFTEPEEVGEDLFGTPSQVKVEMPPEPPPAETPAFTDAVTETPPAYAAGEPTAGPAAYEAPAGEDDAGDLGAIRPQYVQKRSMVLPILLIFLVPWSIFWPAVAIYFWNAAREASHLHPLKTLPDTDPKGGPRELERVKHDLKLDADQITQLGAPIRVGDLEVTPERVAYSDEGNLVLTLRMKNVSRNLVFTPTSDRYLEVSNRTTALPYTFLESQNFKRLYGGHLEWRRGDKAINEGNADLRPNQEERVLLSTMDKNRDVVRKLAVSSDKLLWRVQVRRGLVEHQGRPVSATAVIGIQFTPVQIEMPRKDA